MEKFFKKYPGKPDAVIGAICGISLFFAYRVGLRIGTKWPYVLLIMLSIIVYKLLHDSLSMKFLMVVNILYSVFMLVQKYLNLDWVYKLKDNEQKVLALLFFVFISLGYIMSVVSSLYVLVFGFVAGACFRLVLYGISRIPRFLRSVFWEKVRGPMPNVQSIAKGDIKVYFQKDYHEEQIQLIYRKGSKKRILDTYQWNDFQEAHYSLEQHGKNCLIVHKYDPTTSTQVEEKEYKL